MASDAVISEDGKYRYVLRRSLGSILRWHRPMLFVMLNPSTADAIEDDRTIRRCIGFAKREGRTHLTVVNLFALRATDPEQLALTDDPVGPDNDRWLDEEIGRHSLIVAAWGQHSFAKARSDWFRKTYGEMLCFGTNKDGSPKHPLYLPKDTLLQEFKPQVNAAC